MNLQTFKYYLISTIVNVQPSVQGTLYPVSSVQN